MNWDIKQFLFNPSRESLRPSVFEHLDNQASLDWFVQQVFIENGELEGHLSWKHAFVCFLAGLECGLNQRRLVELGAFKGRSTVFFCRGLTAMGAKPSELITVDEWFHPDFFLHMQKFLGRLPTLVQWRTESSAVFFNNEPNAFGCLFVDAGHEEKDVAADTEHWLPLVAKDGLVIFHDYGPDYPGIVTVVDRLVATGALRQVGRHDIMFVCRKN